MKEKERGDRVPLSSKRRPAGGDGGDGGDVGGEDERSGEGDSVELRYVCEGENKRGWLARERVERV